jgi:magnesium chelatase subunit I
MQGRPATIGELKASEYRVLSVKDEMRKNLIARLRRSENPFPGIIGYEDTVIPQVETAILAGHDIIFIGERGQAKSRLIRSLVNLLDEEIPVIKGGELNDNPYSPVTKFSRELVAKYGDDTEIEWLGRDGRYSEKLATPDVSVADLIGEVDPIKEAEGRYLSDELTIHFGLIPRTNRGIFAINELPDLVEKVQVGLFNVMEEKDIQIQGY